MTVESQVQDLQVRKTFLLDQNKLIVEEVKAINYSLKLFQAVGDSVEIEVEIIEEE